MHCTICGDPRPAVLAYNRRAWSAAAVEDFERWGSKDHDLDQKSSWARSKKIATICHYAEICAIWPLIHWSNARSLLPTTPIGQVPRHKCLDPEGHAFKWRSKILPRCELVRLDQNTKPRVTLFVPGVFLSSCYSLCLLVCFYRGFMKGSLSTFLRKAPVLTVIFQVGFKATLRILKEPTVDMQCLLGIGILHLISIPNYISI